MSDALIELKGVAKAYGGNRVLHGIDFELGLQAAIGIVGPSGCGKSTLLKIIAGIEDPSKGQVSRQWPNGNGMSLSSINQEADHPRAHTVLVWQHLLLFPGLTARENLLLTTFSQYIPRSEQRARLDRYSRLLGLERLLDRRVEKLSGGERQRVALARGLLVEPVVLALDEPFSHLDRHLRFEARQLVVSLRRELGFSFVMVTHDLEDAQYCCDVIGVMEPGQIVQMGTYRELASAPRTRTVATLVGLSNIIPGTIVTVSDANIANAETAFGRFPIRIMAGQNLSRGMLVMIHASRSAFRASGKSQQGFEMTAERAFTVGERWVVICRSDKFPTAIETYADEQIAPGTRLWVQADLREAIGFV